MARMIDAEILAKKVNEEICRCDCVISTMFARRFKKLIDEQPTIEAEPVKHGKWIVLGQRAGMRYPTHYCSECGEHGWEEYQYCQHCGAKMDKE